MADGVITDELGTSRCWWATGDPEYGPYHDEEWGRPTADDRWIFEKICLEGFQAGLSWITILKKRENFRAGFANFEMDAVAAFDDGDVERLVKDAGIIRHRGKIKSTINNAKCAIEMREEFGSLAAFMWQYEPTAENRPKRITKDAMMKISITAESTALSKELKRRGWSFVGPTTVYAFMQAAGIVNDHLEGCSARPGCLAERANFQKPAK